MLSHFPFHSDARSNFPTFRQLFVCKEKHSMCEETTNNWIWGEEIHPIRFGKKNNNNVNNASGCRQLGARIWFAWCTHKRSILKVFYNIFSLFLVSGIFSILVLRTLLLLIILCVVKVMLCGLFLRAETNDF